MERESASGIVEVKCRYGKDHPHSIDELCVFFPQIQGYMEILDVEFCHLVSYTPKKTSVLELKRDRVFFGLMLSVLEDFRECLRLGVVPPPTHSLIPTLQSMAKETSKWKLAKN